MKAGRTRQSRPFLDTGTTPRKITRSPKETGTDSGGGSGLSTDALTLGIDCNSFQGSDGPLGRRFSGVDVRGRAHEVSVVPARMKAVA